MKNNLSILGFHNDKWYTIYNKNFKIYIKIELEKNNIQNNIITILSNSFEHLDVEIKLSKTQVHFYYENIEHLLSKDSIVVDMQLRIILTKLNILNKNS